MRHIFFKLKRGILKFDKKMVRILEHIKIYIDTCIMVLIAIMTIKLTYVSNHINQMQLEMEEARNRPSFTLVYERNEIYNDDYLDIMDLNDITCNTLRIYNGELIWDKIDKSILYEYIGGDARLLKQVQKGVRYFINRQFSGIKEAPEAFEYKIINTGDSQIANINCDFNTYFWIGKEEETKYYYTFVKVRDRYRLNQSGDAELIAYDDDIAYLIYRYLDEMQTDKFSDYSSFNTVNIRYTNYMGNDEREDYLVYWDSKALMNISGKDFMKLDNYKKNSLDSLTNNEFWNDLFDSDSWIECTEDEYRYMEEYLEEAWFFN